MTARLRVYNNWAAEFTRADPRTLQILGMVRVREAGLARSGGQACVEEWVCSRGGDAQSGRNGN